MKRHEKIGTEWLKSQVSEMVAGRCFLKLADGFWDKGRPDRVGDSNQRLGGRGFSGAIRQAQAKSIVARKDLCFRRGCVGLSLLVEATGPKNFECVQDEG